MTRFMWDPKTGVRHLFRDDQTPPSDFIDHHPGDKSKGTQPDSAAAKSAAAKSAAEKAAAEKAAAEKAAAEKAAAEQAAEKAAAEKAAAEKAAAEKAAAEKAAAEKAAAGKAGDKYPEMTVNEMTAALEMAGFEYDKSANKAALGDLLREKLHVHLTKCDTEYAETDDLKALMEKATK